MVEGEDANVGKRPAHNIRPFVLVKPISDECHT